MGHTIFEIYTDGSCNPKLKIGGWAAIIFFNGEKIILEGHALDTYHHGMELTAVIKALKRVKEKYIPGDQVIVYSDSQYVAGIHERKEKLKDARFLTKSNLPVRNEGAVRSFIQYIESMDISFVKIRAHQKVTGIHNYNRDVDRLSRKIVRELVKKHKKG